MSDEAKITNGESSNEPQNSFAEIVSTSLETQEAEDYLEAGDISIPKIMPESQDIVPSTNVPKITLSSLGIDIAQTSNKDNTEQTQAEINNSSPFKIEKNSNIVITEDVQNTVSEEKIVDTDTTVNETMAPNEEVSPVSTGTAVEKVADTQQTVNDSVIPPNLPSPPNGNKLITLESLHSENTPKEKPVQAIVKQEDTPNISKTEDKEIFKNYESTFHSRKSTILMQLKKMRQIAKTNMVFIIFAITLTFLGVYGLSYTDSRIHNLHNYKASVQGNYNIIATSFGLPTVIVDAPELKDVIGVTPIGDTNQIVDNSKPPLLPITATATATGTTIQTSQKPKNTVKHNPYVIPQSTGEKAQITKEILKDYFSD